MSSNKIDGLKVIPLKKIPDERGTIFHMLRRDSDYFTEFGEIYFSKIYQGAIKAWHKHSKMTLNYACISGMIKLVIYDDREDSSTKGNLVELFIGEDNYQLVQIPPNLWNGHKGIKESIVANCASHPHDPTNSIRIDPINNDIINYNWEIKNK